MSPRLFVFLRITLFPHSILIQGIKTIVFGYWVMACATMNSWCTVNLSAFILATLCIKRNVNSRVPVRLLNQYLKIKCWHIHDFFEALPGWVVRIIDTVSEGLHVFTDDEAYITTETAIEFLCRKFIRKSQSLGIGWAAYLNKLYCFLWYLEEPLVFAAICKIWQRQ